MDQRKYKINSNFCTQLLFLKVIKDIRCTIIQPWKKNSSKQSSKAPKYHDIHAHDDCM